MKQKICLSTLFACLALTGCGGGGGSSSSPSPSTPPIVPVSTIERFATGVGFLSPKHMVFVGTNLFIADQTAGGRIAELDSVAQTLVSAGTVSVTSPLGIAVLSNGVYFTARDSSSYEGIYLLGSSSSLVSLSISNNFGGMTFFSTNMLFVANGSSVLLYSASDNFSVATQSLALSSPVALAADASKGLVYSSLGNDTVASINPINLAVSVLTQTNPAHWGPFLKPQGIAVSSNGYAYVVSQGNASGDGGYVSKVNTSTGVTEVVVSDSVGNWGVLPVGLCAPTGVAIDATNEYLYVSNGNTCTDPIHHQNHDQILKIKLP